MGPKPTLNGPSPPSPERCCFQVRRPEWSETGQSGRSPLNPAELVPSPVHASCPLPPARLRLNQRLLAQQTPKRSRSSTAAAGGARPRAPMKNHPRTPLQRYQTKVSDASATGSAQHQPFASRGADVQVLGLDDAARDLANHHLQSSGRGGQEKGYLGPRHAIRDGTSSKRQPHCDCMALGGTRKAGRCACAIPQMHVQPKSPEARQS